MRLSRERLRREATATGFRVEILEKVAQLLDLLDGFNRHPYLKRRLALKGGTALNLFVFDVPRLSIDIDLNYVGQIDREAITRSPPIADTSATWESSIESGPSMISRSAFGTESGWPMSTVATSNAMEVAAMRHRR